MSHVTHINESWHTEVLKQEMPNFIKLDLFAYNYPLYAAVYAGYTSERWGAGVETLFRKRATNYRALLWKVTYEDKGSYIPIRS